MNTRIFAGAFVARDRPINRLHLCLSIFFVACMAIVDRGITVRFFIGSVPSPFVIIGAQLFTVVLLTWVAARERSRIRDFYALHWPGTGSVILWAIAAGPFVVAELLRTNFGGPWGQPNVKGSVVGILTVLFTGPLIEECLYRGLLVRWGEKLGIGPVGIVIYSAAIFCSAHGYSLWASAWVFFLGVLFMAARLKTGSVLTPLVMHVLVNAAFGLPLQMDWSSFFVS